MLFRKHWLGRKAILSPHSILVFCCIISLFLLKSFLSFTGDHVAVGALTTQHVQNKHAVGGRWYIPSSWSQEGHAIQVEHNFSGRTSILEAAEYACKSAFQQRSVINSSHIPLIIHQTWMDMNADTWSYLIRERVERWLSVAAQPEEEFLTGPEMAWFLWDDDGVDALIKTYEPDLYDDFQRLPYPVEKADLFRVVVLKWFGGIYADVDAEPLKHPFEWIHESDLSPWIEGWSGKIHGLAQPPSASQANTTERSSSYQDIVSPPTVNEQPPINAIFGIGADNSPAPDSTYWRMGYTYPVQITNWASAMAPKHPVADKFIHNLKSMIAEHTDDLPTVDPLEITGPPALTSAIQTIVHRHDPDLAWDALSARNGDAPGGRGKVVAGDVLILPITGFNPGRGWFQNMGSKPITHPNARLRHAAAGSWRSLDLKVHWGKFCRQAFGMCREWSKIPDPVPEKEVRSSSGR